jgi:hypothetical protein
MFTVKEAFQILIAIVVFAFIIWFLKDFSFLAPALIIAAVVLLVNVFAQKLVTKYEQAKIEFKTWHFQRWGYYERSYLKKPFPSGIVFPFLLVVLSYPTGFLKMLTFLQSEITPTRGRHIKIRGGLARFSEMKEYQIGIIPTMGMVANLFLSFLLIIFTRDPLLIQIAQYSTFYCMWNIFPVGNLDGTKILFGSQLTWACLFVATVIMTVICLLV